MNIVGLMLYNGKIKKTKIRAILQHKEKDNVKGRMQCNQTRNKIELKI
jgi:hypothetical protein